MKLFTTKQIAEIDRLTGEMEPVSGIALMERAAMQVSDWLAGHFAVDRKLLILAGPGNNGGDALAVARQMANRGYDCEVYMLHTGGELRGLPAVNYRRLQEQAKVSIRKITSPENIPLIKPDHVVVDGLFGAGLNRPLERLSLVVAGAVNSSGATVVAIDVPSGLFGEDNSGNNLENVVKARHTLTFQFPKLSFLFPEHSGLLGKWEILPIGLHPDAIARTETPFSLLTGELAASILRERNRFDHKGTFGHALLIAGSRCKIGAAVLASRAALRSGVGLLTCHVPNPAVPILQGAVPEAMCSADASDLMFTEFPDLSSCSAVGIGPGLGTKPNTQRGLLSLLKAGPQKMVLDADALNILSMNPDWMGLLPDQAILTPHLKEFERLVGVTGDSWSRLQAQIRFSMEYGVILVLKGAGTGVSLPDGRVFFNTTGNPGMATAGSGDVLTGMILGLLAQSYAPADAALLGVYLHGLSGDLAAAEEGQDALVAGDLTRFLGKAFLSLRNPNP